MNEDKINIDEAIRELELLWGILPYTLLKKQGKAVKLGIEALKHIKALRVSSKRHDIGLLSGETE